MNTTRRAAKTFTCWACTTTVSTSGFASTAHERGAAHIANLIAKGQTEEAARIQRQADFAARNRATQAAAAKAYRAKLAAR